RGGQTQRDRAAPDAHLEPPHDPTRTPPFYAWWRGHRHGIRKRYWPMSPGGGLRHHGPSPKGQSFPPYRNSNQLTMPFTRPLICFYWNVPLQTVKDSPQPQLAFSLGLTNLKPSLSPSRTKSTSVPSMYCMLSGSTNSLTPCCSNSRSSARASSTYSIL